MGLVLKRIGYGVLSVLFCLVAWLQLTGRIYLATADLGRHIRNGEAALVQHHILATNYYSYTNPDFPAPCHHWGSGAIFYLVWKAFDFNGLSIFYATMLLFTLLLFTWAGARAGSWGSALLAAAVALPLIGDRIEIRPEGFSTLFLGVGFLLLYGERAGWLGRRWLWLIPLVQLVWVNVHILFFLGFAQLAIFLIDAVLVEGVGHRFKMLLTVTLAAAALSFVNPFGAEGFFEPMGLFGVHNYKILAEDQTIFWMMRRSPGKMVYPLAVATIVTAAALVLLRTLVERNWRQAFLPLALVTLFGFLAINSVRSIAMFGFFFVPIAAENWQRVVEGLGQRWRSVLQAATAFAATALIVAAAMFPRFAFSPLQKFGSIVAGQPPGRSLLLALSQPDLWRGLVPSVNATAAFIKKTSLRGPMFNNYDIGGYFIFHLYPEERPFIDNRPEAYPEEFLRDVYTPMQGDEEVWASKDKQFGFQAIVFYRHDMTPFAQPFLIRRIKDPAWAPVFVDAYSLVLAKRGGVNQETIARFELPRSLFGLE